MNTDDRRLLLAFVLSLLVFVAYQIFLTHRYPPPAVSPSNSASSVGITDTLGAPPAVSPQLPAVASVISLAAGSADREETDVLRGNGLEITTTTQGAGIRQIRLLGIPRLPHKDTRDVILIDENASDPMSGIYLPGHSRLQGFKKVSASEDRILYLMDVASPSGRPYFRVTRKMELHGKRHEIRIETKIQNLSDREIQFGVDTASAVGLAISPFPKKTSKSSLEIHEMFVKLGEDVVHRKESSPGFFDSLMGRKKDVGVQHETLDGVLRWISLDDRYFTATLIPDSPLARALLSVEGQSLSAEAQYASWTLLPNQEKTFQESLYAGPKSPDVLREYGKDLLEIMNFGWFGWLGFWMLRLMDLFHRVIPNYGVAIIFLTCIVRIVLYPLTYKSYVSMAKLKELSPKMKAIQEKYKDNKEKLNKELMKMYQENKVNPAGGCLPILLQIPVFIAFYRMLQYAIELRGASFLWINDLSEKDPYFILPIAMGISMLIQQKMTPSPDPDQAKIGMMMTVVFTFMFLSFPAGLNLYWFVSTLLGIWQQKIIERKLKPAAAPAA